MVYSRNPLQNFVINPQRNYSINPAYNYSINPRHNYSINPDYNYTIDPIHNYSINPMHNLTINPNYNYSLNPKYNFGINPYRNFAISPLHNDDIPGWYYFNLKNICEGFTVKVNDADFLISYSNNLEITSFWIKRSTGYSIFDTVLNYFRYAESDGNTGFNVFDRNGNWIGHLK